MYTEYNKEVKTNYTGVILLFYYFTCIKISFFQSKW